MPPRSVKFGNLAVATASSERAVSLFSVEDDGRAYRELPLNQIEPNPNQPRRIFDAGSLQELADTIKKHGLLQPILVEEIGAGRFKILAGERRWRAMALAGKGSIPAVVMVTEDRAALALIENVQRVDLHAIEVARALDDLIKSKGLRQEDAGALIGKSRTTVTKMLSILNLPQDILNEAKNISSVILMEIAATDTSSQHDLWLRAKDGITLREMRELKRNALQSSLNNRLEGATTKASATQRPISFKKAVSGLGRQFETVLKTVQMIRNLPPREAPLDGKSIDALREVRSKLDSIRAGLDSVIGAT